METLKATSKLTESRLFRPFLVLASERKSNAAGSCFWFFTLVK